ncbi:ARM REPEAT PROTEIN INTERACTING WITH ABF2-like [Malania oleifera]|uniref:ARM REPEAT PROTEIN INTERACTING WITH ABF2-like n=1 Tax=Malania oleifera TaxID=397392 RepID=UPI0025ADAD5D|nr:ARM REPEAT PROTEIN INTERACTING WITH ABF2-like [Malania oleifera]
MGEEEKTIQGELSLLLLLAERVRKSAEEAELNKPECQELSRQVERLSLMLRSAVRLASGAPCLFERPVRRVAGDVAKNLERALTLVRKCKHSGVLRQLFAITTTADFRKVSTLLESSAGDMRWLLTIFDPEDTNLALPPIASNDPILAWVWSYIAAVQMHQLRDRTDAASELSSLARDNDRNKQMIVQEGGVPPLLKLLKEGASPDAQIAAATALCNLATNQERVRYIAKELGVPIIVQVLGDSPMRVQVSVANLVSRMAEMDEAVKEEFARENVNKPLVTLLSMDLALEDPKLQTGKNLPSIHSIVLMNKELTRKGTNPIHYQNVNSSPSRHSEGSSRGGHNRKEREGETPELKLQLKVSCAEALWKLCRGSVRTSKKITETKGLLCLAKLIEKEQGELQLNCLMTVVEIATVAELNSDLRQAAFKINSLAAKAVLDQLLRVIQEESHPILQIPAIKAIGSLARTFSSKETRIIKPLVLQLGQRNPEVAMEAAIALVKFACPENYNCIEHSKTIIEFDGVPPLMRLLKMSEQVQIHGLVLLCYLALHVGNSKALEEARALNALEGAARSVAAQNPELRDLFAKAVHHLTLYQAGVHPHRPSHGL